MAWRCRDGNSGLDPLCQGFRALCACNASAATGVGLAGASLGLSIGYLHLFAADDVFGLKQLLARSALTFCNRRHSGSSCLTLPLSIFCLQIYTYIYIYMLEARAALRRLHHKSW